ncbi:MAG: glycosyltransferase family 39 protein [Anaerolineaceae bacterium]|nr:glycosyltransferase family 39 protein [Anaerolineaceae bacterium]
MSPRTGFVLATLFLLIAATLRSYRLADLPTGFNEDEYLSLRIVESLRAGHIAVFYDQSPTGAAWGREGLYPALLGFGSSLTGGGSVGFRVFSVFVSLLTLALVYTLARRLCGVRGAVAALSLLSVSLWPVLLGRSVTPMNLTPLMSAATMLSTVQILSVPPRIGQRLPGTIAFTLLGIAAGIGFYVHPVQFWLVLGTLLFIYWLTRSQGPLTLTLILSLLFVLGLALVVMTPYLLSSLRLPELSGFARLLGDYDVTVSPPMQSVANTLTGIALVGDSSPLHNVPGRPLFDLVSGLICLAGLLAAFRFRHRPRFALPLVFLVALAPATLFVNNSPDFASMAVLLPSLALLFGFGVATLSINPGQLARFIPMLAIVVLPGLNIVWTGHDLFNVWASSAETKEVWNDRVGQLARHIEASADDLPTVVCLPTVEPEPSLELGDAWRLLLLLHDRGEDLRYADCLTGLVLASGGELQQIILPDPATLANMHPLLRDWLQENALNQNPPSLQDSAFLLDVRERLGDRVGSFTTTSTLRLAPEAPGGAVDLLPPVTLDSNLTFLGYEPRESRIYREGDALTSVTWWRVDGPLHEDLRLFIHVMPDPAVITSQNDRISVLPSSLRPRDIFIQVTYVSLPASTPPGNYLVSTGAYRQGDKQRLAILIDGEARGTRLFLSDNAFTVGAGDG